MIDKLSVNFTLQDWIPLEGTKKGKFKIIMDNGKLKVDAQVVFSDNKADHKILNTVSFLEGE